MLLVTRLVIRRLRLELLICLGASIALATLACALAHTLAQAHIPGAVGSWMGLVPYTKAMLIAAPVLAGLLIGISLVATEIERGTSAFTWSVALNRRWWLAQTVLAGAALVIVISLPGALASDQLSHAIGPRLDATALTTVDSAWALLLARPLVAYAIAVLVSLVVGRSLPALLVGLVATAIVLGAIEGGFSVLREAQTTVIDPSDAGVLYMGDGFVGPGARIVTNLQAETAAHDLGIAFGARYRPVSVGLTPGTRTATLVGQLALTTFSVVVLVAVAGLLVEHRRPT